MNNCPDVRICLWLKLGTALRAHKLINSAIEIARNLLECCENCRTQRLIKIGKSANRNEKCFFSLSNASVKHVHVFPMFPRALLLCCVTRIEKFSLFGNSVFVDCLSPPCINICCLSIFWHWTVPWTWEYACNWIKCGIHFISVPNLSFWCLLLRQRQMKEWKLNYMKFCQFNSRLPQTLPALRETINFNCFWLD